MERCQTGSFTREGSLGSGPRTCGVSASCRGMPCASLVVSSARSEEAAGSTQWVGKQATGWLADDGLPDRTACL